MLLLNVHVCPKNTSMKGKDLVELEQKALAARAEGDVEKAAELFTALVQKQPNWEHGAGFYNLACCYEDLGKFDLADECYRRALQFEPKFDIFVGGYASFLYLHGDLNQALQQYLSLLGLQKRRHDDKRAEGTVAVLRTIGERLGLSNDAVTERIKTHDY
jgi:tetratricopeptide (TPR) repeat protein